MPSSTAWSTTPTASSCMATACAGNAPPYLPRLDPNHPLEGDNHLPTDERHPGRHQSEWPADMTLESVADIAPEQAADIIGIWRLLWGRGTGVTAAQAVGATSLKPDWTEPRADGGYGDCSVPAMDDARCWAVREVTCRRCARQGGLVEGADGLLVGRRTRIARPMDLGLGAGATRGTRCSAPWSALIDGAVAMVGRGDGVMSCRTTWAGAAADAVAAWRRAASGRRSKGRCRSPGQ